LLFSSIIPNILRDAFSDAYFFWRQICNCDSSTCDYTWLCDILTSNSVWVRAISLLITSCIPDPFLSLQPISPCLNTTSFTSIILNLSFLSNHQYFATITSNINIVTAAITNTSFFHVPFFHTTLSATVLKFNNDLFIIRCKSRQRFNLIFSLIFRLILIYGNSFFFLFLFSTLIFYLFWDIEFIN